MFPISLHIDYYIKISEKILTAYLIGIILKLFPYISQ